MAKKIIIRTPNYIGDTVMMLPALELVRIAYPEAEITVVCKPHSVGLFRGKNIAKIITDDTKGKERLGRTVRFIKQLRKEKYDLGILFHNSFLTALSFRLARIKTLIGYEKEGRKFLLNFSLPINRNWHYVNHYAGLVNQFLENKYDTLPPMQLATESSKLLPKTNKPMIGFVLGTELEKKQNPKEQYRQNLKKGVRKYPKEQGKDLFELLSQEDFHFVLLGDQTDCENHSAYAKILAQNQKSYTDLTGKTTLEQFIDAIAQLDLLVTVDTSAMHIAAATQTPFLLLAGLGTSPLSVVFPKQENGYLLEKGQQCLRAEDMLKSIQPKDIYTYIMEIRAKKVIFGGKSS